MALNALSIFILLTCSPAFVLVASPVAVIVADVEVGMNGRISAGIEHLPKDLVDVFSWVEFHDRIITVLEMRLVLQDSIVHEKTAHS